VVKQRYLQAILEALAEAPWPGNKKRARLNRTGMPHLSTDYAYVYDLPFDCARPLELLSKQYYEVEGRLLTTDDPEPTLLYVQNGKKLRLISRVEAPTPEELAAGEMEYLTGGHHWGSVEAIIRGAEPGDFPYLSQTDTATGQAIPLRKIGEDGLLIGGFLLGEDSDQEVQDPEILERNEDYPDYRPISLEPKLAEYVEKKLAALLALTFSKDQNIHTLKLQEAMIARQDAEQESVSAGAAEEEPRGWWTDEITGKRGGRRAYY
jgi:hypothetical protein